MEPRGLLQLNFRDMAPRDHNEAYQSARHVHLDSRALRSFGWTLLIYGGLNGRCSWHAVFEGIREDDVSVLLRLVSPAQIVGPVGPHK